MEISEVEMTNYQMIDSYPVATEIFFRNNGELYMKEVYFDVSFPAEVDDKIFDPKYLIASNGKRSIVTRFSNL